MWLQCAPYLGNKMGSIKSGFFDNGDNVIRIAIEHGTFFRIDLLGGHHQYWDTCGHNVALERRDHVEAVNIRHH